MLPQQDLNQDAPFVRSTFLKWAATLKAFGFDGLRVDTVPEVKPAFWAGLTQASQMYTLGDAAHPKLPAIPMDMTQTINHSLQERRSTAIQFMSRNFRLQPRIGIFPHRCPLLRMLVTQALHRAL